MQCHLQGVDKPRRSRSDCFIRSSLISVFPVCYSRPLVKSAYQKINFLISQPKHMLWVLKTTVSMSAFDRPKLMFKLMDEKIFTILRPAYAILTSILRIPAHVTIRRFFVYFGCFRLFLEWSVRGKSNEKHFLILFLQQHNYINCTCPSTFYSKAKGQALAIS